MADAPGFLRIQGNRIVDGEARPLVLRGFGLGGWMNMENFITGYPANEEAQRRAIRQVLGSERYELFFDRFLEYFFTEGDARFIRSLGLNLLRLPINYRHLEDDAEPYVVKEEGFKHLDRVIELCAEHGIYTIIDLHALPGYQNQHWHCDNPTHKALLWRHRHFQEGRSTSGRSSPPATETTPGSPVTTRSTSQPTRASSSSCHCSGASTTSSAASTRTT
jgi:endoglucanase